MDDMGAPSDGSNSACANSQIKPFSTQSIAREGMRRVRRGRGLLVLIVLTIYEENRNNSDKTIS